MEPVDSNTNKVPQTSFRVDPVLLKRFRVRCAEADLSQQDAIAVAIEQWLSPAGRAGPDAPMAAQVWAWLDSPLASEQDYHIRRLVAAMIGSDELLQMIDQKERSYRVPRSARAHNTGISPAPKPNPKRAD